ncbi:hypothetical protein PV328_000100 [Microctonus aethiopoides]|uniref:AAA-ATPase-like domain-containing protein n=1 Tax=Microctonus aethiopoides TaxID=144406 RepID=A0AA39FUV9_9HYME|nr:hypothetical protein PV328_000100 [Microctonus aethiopoides]
MESPTAKRPKMDEHESNESTPTSSDTKEMKKPNFTYSTYDYHYNDPYYVDKTLLIKSLFKTHHVLITAPSRFGKSLNMDMVRRFVEVEVDDKGKRIVLDVDENTHYLKDDQPSSKNFKLFKGKNIFEDKEFVLRHFGKYPTIFVDFAALKGSNFEEILDQLREVIHEAFQKHDYLLYNKWWRRSKFNKQTFMKYFDSEKRKLLTQDEIEYGLVFLSKVLHSYHGRKVFVFFEEFDVPVNTMVYEGQMSLDDRKKTIKVLQTITQKLLKGSNDFVERSLSNACQQLGGVISESANNVKVCRYLQTYSFTEFYGFREDEVISLLKIANKCDHFDIVKSRYDGYLTKSSKGGWSAGIRSEVLKIMGDPRMEDQLIKLINFEPVQITYEERLDHTHIDTLYRMFNKDEINRRSIDLFTQLLYELGFLYPVSSSPGSLVLRIPNTTVSDRIKRVWYDIYFDKKYPIEADQKFIDALDGMAKSCNDASVRALAQSIENLFKDAVIPPKERLIQCILFAYIQKKLKMSGVECKTDKNTLCDVVFVDRTHKCGIVIKIKSPLDPYMTSVKGFEQILKNEYYTILDEESLEKLFLKSPGTVINKILMCIHVNNDNKVSITYADGHMEEPRTVCTENA